LSNPKVLKTGRMTIKVCEIVVLLMITDAIPSVALYAEEIWAVTSLPVLLLGSGKKVYTTLGLLVEPWWGRQLALMSIGEGACVLCCYDLCVSVACVTLDS
jgi:hypothetical protein